MQTVAQKEYQRQYYLKNRERIKARTKAYALAHPEAVQQWHAKADAKIKASPVLLQRQRDKSNRWTRLNPEKVRQLRVDRRNRNYTAINAIKQGKTCKYCTEFTPVCLDFHHIDPETKLENVARLVASNTSWDNVLAEIAKCVLICSNCHRKLHKGLLCG